MARKILSRLGPGIHQGPNGTSIVVIPMSKANLLDVWRKLAIKSSKKLRQWDQQQVSAFESAHHDHIC